MKQVQSGATPHRLAGRGRWWPPGPSPTWPEAPARRRPASGPGSGLAATATLAGASIRVVLAVLAAAWRVITLPVRLAFWAIAWLGRLTAIAIGFSLMVAGMFFLAGPFFLIGLPLFLVGLVLTLRCLD